MTSLYAQGDILIERVEGPSAAVASFGELAEETIILAQGEATGHQHRVAGMVRLFRDEALAREIPRGLYVAHVAVLGAFARLEHEEHATITLQHGVYCVRRQRQLEPSDVGMLEEFGIMGD